MSYGYNLSKLYELFKVAVSELSRYNPVLSETLKMKMWFAAWQASTWFKELVYFEDFTICKKPAQKNILMSRPDTHLLKRGREVFPTLRQSLKHDYHHNDTPSLTLQFKYVSHLLAQKSLQHLLEDIFISPNPNSARPLLSAAQIRMNSITFWIRHSTFWETRHFLRKCQYRGLQSCFILRW